MVLIEIDLDELEALCRYFEANTTETAGITLDLRRRFGTDLLTRVAAYDLPTRDVAYESERIGEALVARVAELEAFTLDLERVWAEAKGLAQEGRLAPGVSGTVSDLWWFGNTSNGGDGTDSLAFAAAAAPTPVTGETAVAAVAAGARTGDPAAIVAAVLSIAGAEVGYVEESSPDYPDGNYTRYWEELHPGFQGAPWCAAFVSWAFLHAGFPLPPMGQWYGFSYVPAAYDHFNSIGRFFPEPMPGDVFVSLGQEHTGIVTSGLSAAGTFHTIEGNTSPDTRGSQTNGGGAYTKVRNLSWMEGFCRPDFDALHR